MLVKLRQISWTRDTMIPENVADAARDGDLETVRAYFEDSDGARDVDDICENSNTNFTLLMMCCARGNVDLLTLRDVEVARYLVSLGASIDKKATMGQTALLIACYTSSGAVTEMVELLLSAGANPNTRNSHGRTALSAHVDFCSSPSMECVTALLRAGASLDRAYDEHTFEEYHYEFIDLYEDPRSFWPAMKALVAGVRRNGSFKRYLREPHRAVLALRGLAMRGHLALKGTRRTRGTEWKAAAAFLARLGDNGVVWNVLSFWRATN